MCTARSEIRELRDSCSRCVRSCRVRARATCSTVLRWSEPARNWSATFSEIGRETVHTAVFPVYAGIASLVGRQSREATHRNRGRRRLTRLSAWYLGLCTPSRVSALSASSPEMFCTAVNTAVLADIGLVMPSVSGAARDRVGRIRPHAAVSVEYGTTAIWVAGNRGHIGRSLEGVFRLEYRWGDLWLRLAGRSLEAPVSAVSWVGAGLRRAVLFSW